MDMDMQRAPTPNYLKPEEIRTIINAVSEISKHAERDTLVLELMWQTGCRVTEAVELKPKSVGVSSIVLLNLKQIKKIKLKDGTVTKVLNKKAVKEVQVSEDLCSQLKNYCRRNKLTKGHYIFQANWDPNKHLDRRYVHRLVTKASEYAGVFKPGKNNPRTGSRNKGAYPHLFRHSNAIFLLNKIGDPMIAQHQLGHAIIQTTLAYIPSIQRKAKRKIKNIKW